MKALVKCLCAFKFAVIYFLYALIYSSPHCSSFPLPSSPFSPRRLFPLFFPSSILPHVFHFLSSPLPFLYYKNFQKEKGKVGLQFVTFLSAFWKAVCILSYPRATSSLKFWLVSVILTNFNLLGFIPASKRQESSFPSSWFSENQKQEFIV